MRAERNAHLPPARQRADVAVHHFLAKVQPSEHFARAPLKGVAVQLLETPLNLAIALDDFFNVVQLVRVRHGGLQFLELGGHEAHRPGAVHRLGHRAAARHLAHVLAEIADGDALIDRHLALVRDLLAGDHPEQRGLAGPVRADETDLLALEERRRGLDEQDLMAILLTDIFETNHARGPREDVAPPLRDVGLPRKGPRNATRKVTENEARDARGHAVGSRATRLREIEAPGSAARHSRVTSKERSEGLKGAAIVVRKRAPNCSGLLHQAISLPTDYI